ncbi:MAG: DUF1810 domain-containing protein [Methylococcaceae bacterium]|nr:DUF1810 domain-containing protein [Methylococcaceae bacterium]MCI0732542.1 DUF1810 domain-containing protein [Methylococcaceae bacterium]
MSEHYDLQRFIKAQDTVYESVVSELTAGQKRGHWMWYIFPQVQGLGSSSMAQKYAIASREEAKAYSEHPILGTRLRECTRLVMNIEGHSAEQIFQYPDHLKFRSCMTLFEHSATDHGIFRDALLKYFDGKPDRLTLDMLKKR